MDDPFYVFTDFLFFSLRMRCDGCGQSVSEKEMSVTSHNKTFRYVHHVGCCICITCKRSIRSEECHFYYKLVV